MTNSSATSSGSRNAAPKRRRRRSNPAGQSGEARTTAPAVRVNVTEWQQSRREQAAAAMSDWSPESFVVEPAEGKVRFHDFDLPAPLMRAISEQGFNYCTPIQAGSLLYTLHGVDLIGKAQTGTGKTAAFLIAILTYLLEEEVPEGQKIGAPRALILAPTRELVLQICKDAETLMQYTPFKLLSVVGGMDYVKQRDQLRSEPIDLLVATPGRLLDFHSKRDVDLREVEVLVLDEADRMLDMGFIPDVKRIIRATPPKEKRQTMLFSATFTQDIMNLAAQWTIHPQRVEIATKVQTADNIEQHAFLVSDNEKLKLLIRIIEHWKLTKVMVFSNRRDSTRNVCEALKKAGINVAMLSGEVEQKKRIATLESFREGKIEVLVATDVAGRGIHIDDVSHVINFNLPEDPEDYVHRIGRTGRAGALGTSISFIGEEDAFALPGIEALTKSKLPCVYPPDELLQDDA
ncbi:DEAD/DEAH box helicase [Marinospirillum alkaliphilum]|uniref:ATP-dependent RNA helicase RhlB n=1 Tax=Marinospirillum alkaliphilum DSM 21637 TaxID=1122209 RepID=A0A1K1U3R1_9GAMM|nr:DEAD/DEAH box helicase [Marinospirillum alkaliphilum]SFX07292.1 ATP-dependent RNA helicase RhlB [Marinospirillum alkaliphilum DSM 21637]